MTDESKPPSNGGQNYEQVVAASEQAIRNLVGIPISLREHEETKIDNVADELALFREEVRALVATREAELRRTIDDLERLRSREKASNQEMMERIEVDLRRQFDQIKEQVDQRDIAAKEAVAEAKNTASTAVTKAETSGANAIIQAQVATKSAVDSVKEIFDQQILYLRERFDVYTAQHKEVHDSEHIAQNKFEDQSAEWARALTEFQRSSSIAAESFVKRDSLDDVRRGLEQTITQRYESLSGASERGEKATNDRIAALEARSQNTVGRDGANTQYIGYLVAAIGILIAIAGYATR